MAASSQARSQKLAPWLPPQDRFCFCRILGNFANLLWSLLILVWMLVIGIVLAILEIPKSPFRWLLREAMSGFGTIVEHAYALPICKLHVSFARMVQMHGRRRRYHSRYSDIRTELVLAGEKSKGTCFVHAVPMLGDNYAYVIVDATAMASSSAGQGAAGGLPAVVVDPCDAYAVAAALVHIAERHYAAYGGIRLEAVLCTHRHWDHAGGNTDLAYMAACYMREESRRAAVRVAEAPTDNSSAETSRQTGREEISGAVAGPPLLSFEHPLRIYSGEGEFSPGCTHPLRHGDRFRAGALDFEALAAPGHTACSLMFRLATAVRHMDDRPGAGPEAQVPPAPSTGDTGAGGAADGSLPMEVIFTGDTMFSGGCGAQFEGDNLDIEHCFATVLDECKLPDALLFPGHEYTCRLLETRVKEAVDTWSGIEPPGNFLAACGAFYVAAHKRSLRDKVPTVPTTLASERILNPHFDRSLRRHAQVLMELVQAEANAQVADGEVSAGTGSAREGQAGKAGRGPGPLLPDRRPASPVQQDSAQQLGSGTGAAGAVDESRLPLLKNARAPAGGTGLAAPQAPASSSSPPAEVEGAAADAAAEEPPEGDYFTGTQAPAFQFAFFYRADLEELRADLAVGRISGPEAATRLLELEDRTFAAPLVTGGADRFSGEGLTRMEELQMMGVIPPPGAQPQNPEQAAEPPASGNENEASSDSDKSSGSEEETERAAREAAALDSHLPSKELVAMALKVLGVPPNVPVGPKAPCNDDDLPVSIPRLESVLRQLGVAESSLQALLGALRKDGLGDTDEPGCFSVCCRPCTGGDEENIMDSSAQDAGDSGNPRQVVQGQSRDQTLIPLRFVLQSLRPSPVQHPTTCGGVVGGCLRDIRRDFRTFFRDVRRCCRPSKRKPVQPEPPKEESDAPPPPPLTLEERKALMEREERRRHRVTESFFSAHALDGCPLCSGTFRSSDLRRRSSRALEGKGSDGPL